MKYSSADGQLDEFYGLFAEMAKRLQSIGAPRSVAEIDLTKRDTDRIRVAFANLTIDPSYWLTDRRPRPVFPDLEASPSEVVACLLLILGAETCRDEATEGAVWPCVRACLPNSYEAKIFPGKQPSTDLKDGLAQVTERLQLRRAIGWEGSQEYFETIKLQFGFTLRGARRRLAEWIVGIGEPVAVQSLRGANLDHCGSESHQFRRLWLALKHYRANQLPENDVRQILEQSTWIRNSWIDELLKQARSRREQLGVGVGEEPQGRQQAETGDEAQFPGHLRLAWDARDPDLYFELDEDEVESLVSEWNASMLEISIDGSQPCRWIREQSGWRGSRRLMLKNWNATTVTIMSGDGRHSADFEVAGSRLNEDLMVFDEDQGRLLGLQARMKTARAYIVLCDEALELAGAEAANEVQLDGRNVYRLAPGWSESLRLEIKGLVYWQAPISDALLLEQPDLVVSNESNADGRLGSCQRLLLSGVPPEALEVSLLVGTQAGEVRLDRFEADWRTVTPVPLDVRLLTGETRLRVRLKTKDNHRCWRPKTRWNVQGLAVMVCDDQSWERPNWEIWDKPNKPLNCARGRILARVFFSRNERSLGVFEGSRFVTKGTRPFQLLGLVARGAPLLTRDGVELAASVEDQGCVLRFYGKMLGQNRCCVVLRDRIEPSDRHTIMLWTTSGTVRTIRPSGHRIQDHRWDLPPYDEPIAWAIAYDGKCIGSAWRTSELTTLVSGQRTPNTFALLRWFRVPVLSPDMRLPVREAIESNPSGFLWAWLSNKGLDSRELIHEDVPEELFPMLRDLLWRVKIRSARHAMDAMKIFERRAATQGQEHPLGTAQSLAIRQMAEICPPFAWRVLRLIRRKRSVRRAIRDLLGLHDSAPLAQSVSTALTPMHQALGDLLGCDTKEVDGLRNVFLANLECNEPIDWEIERRFRRVAESAYGSRYLAAAVLASSSDIAVVASDRGWRV